MEASISILSGLSPRSELLRGDSIVIGRATEVDLLLSHPEVSRRHCRIFFEKGSWFVEDLGSQRGTVVNGGVIRSPTELKSGDQIQIGPVTVGFGAGTSDLVPVPDATGPVNPVGAVLLKGTPASEIPLGSQLIFGRGDEVDVLLNDPVVSRRHAMVETGPNGYRLLDLHSKSGSFVNGR
ncbi:MAG TPA: FHA domain-containing protein, partial [Chthoniobacterales bacterium]